MRMKIYFHTKGYAPRLALKKRYKTTQKWPIVSGIVVVLALIRCLFPTTLSFLKVSQLVKPLLLQNVFKHATHSK